MKCKDCPYFKILYSPIKHGAEIWDFGKARCEKYDAYVDFANKRKLNKMECLEKSDIWGGQKPVPYARCANCDKRITEDEIRYWVRFRCDAYCFCKNCVTVIDGQENKQGGTV